MISSAKRPSLNSWTMIFIVPRGNMVVTAEMIEQAEEEESGMM